MCRLVSARQVVAVCALATLLSPCASSGGAAKEPDPVDSFIQAVKEKDRFAVQMAAAGHYHRLTRDEATRARLLAALRDADPVVRAGVASLIASLRLREGVQPLIAALKDTEARVRDSAAYALGRVARGPHAPGEAVDPAVVPALLALLKDPEGAVRSSAAGALGYVGDPAVLPALVALLKDPDGKVRVRATSALGQLNDPLATEHLIPLIKDDTLHIAAAWALKSIGDPRAAGAFVEALLRPHHCDHCTGASQALRELGGWGVEALLAAIARAEPEPRARLIDALGMSSHPRAAQTLLAMLDDPEVGRVADHALVRNGGWPPRPHEPFVDALLAGQVKARRRAAWWLWRWQDQRAVDLLLVSLSDVDAGVRANAAASLGMLEDRRAVMPLLIALKDMEAEVRREAAEALGRLGDRRSIEPLQGLLHGQPDRVRMAAEKALEAINNHRAKPGGEPEPPTISGTRTRAPAAKAVDHRGLQELVAALRDNGPQVRADAASALGAVKVREATDALLTALEDREALVRRTATIALGETRDERATAPLMEALKDPDYGVRRAAVHSLRALKGGSPTRR